MSFAKKQPTTHLHTHLGLLPSETNKMRLFYVENNGNIGLQEYVDEREAPPYAILSHRWGPDHEEVTLKDIEEGTGRRKKGYQKIVRCGQQAHEDGIDFF